MYIAFASPPRAGGRIASLMARNYDSDIVVFSNGTLLWKISGDRATAHRSWLAILKVPGELHWEIFGVRLGFDILVEMKVPVHQLSSPFYHQQRNLLVRFYRLWLVESWFRIGVETWVASLYINIYLLVYKLLKRQSAARGSLFANWNVAFFTLSVN